MQEPMHDRGANDGHFPPHPSQGMPQVTPPGTPGSTSQGASYGIPYTAPYAAAPKFGSGPGPGPSGGTTTAPGARTAGALICVVLLGIEIAWTFRDINVIGFHDTLWRWLGLAPLYSDGYRHGVPITSALDLVLMVLLVGGLVAARRSSAGGAFVTVGLFAVLYRLPGLWEFTSDWTKYVKYHDRLLSTSIVFVALGVGLLVTASAGRRPAAPVTPGAPTAPGGPPDVPAVRPRKGPAVAAGLLLVVIAVVLVGWQFWFMHEYSGRYYPHGFYKHSITGAPTTVAALLTPPFGWTAWAAVLLALVAAVLAFRQDAVVRPLAMALALYLGLTAVVALDQWHQEHLLFTSHRLPDSMRAEQSFLVLEVLAAVLLIALVALRENPLRVPPPSKAGWGPGAGWGYGAQGAPLGRPGPSGPSGAAPGAWGGGGYGYQAPGRPPRPEVPPQPGAFGPPPAYPPGNTPPPPPPAGPPAG